MMIVKKDTTRDLAMIFSDLVAVKFNKDDKTTTLKGWWCMLCK